MSGPDDLLVSRARLGILSALAANDELDFAFLRNSLDLTDGNLGAQLRNLEQAGYIKIRKRFVDRKPRTLCRITSRGQQALHGLLRYLERALRDGSAGAG